MPMWNYLRPEDLSAIPAEWQERENARRAWACLREEDDDASLVLVTLLQADAPSHRSFFAVVTGDEGSWESLWSAN